MKAVDTNSTNRLQKLNSRIQSQCRLLERALKKLSLNSRYHSVFYGWIFDTFVRKFRFDKLSISIPRSLTDRPFRSRFLWDVYEKAERRLVKKYIPSDAIVLELGGCLGVVSCAIANQLNDSSNHVVLEMNPKLIPVLKENLSINGFKTRVIHGAIGPGSDAKFKTDCLVVDTSIIHQVNLTDECEHIRTVSPEELSLNSKRFTSLVCDIEGVEYYLLSQYSTFIATLNLIIIEFHPDLLGEDNLSKCYTILSRLSFSRIEKIDHVEVWRKTKCTED